LSLPKGAYQRDQQFRQKTMGNQIITLRRIHGALLYLLKNTVRPGLFHPHIAISVSRGLLIETRRVSSEKMNILISPSIRGVSMKIMGTVTVDQKDCTGFQAVGMVFIAQPSLSVESIHKLIHGTVL